MLSPTSYDVIEATLPAVEAHIGRISERFYERLFTAAPLLCTDLFNRTNQRNREQQKALASSVAAFAKLLITEQPQDIDAIMSRIANKHASIGIQAGHYEMIRFHLFAAIAEVLGDAVTPAVAAAWHQVYTLMAGSLIKQEAALYDSAGVPHGHVWRLVAVSEVEYDGADVATFVMRSLNGRPLPDFSPGQYISICVRLPDGTRQIRQYTLVRGRVPGEWAITIKRVPDGLVSSFLFDTVRPGNELIVSHPFGSLLVDAGSTPLVLISAGIGITSTLTALQSLAETDPRRPVVALHVDRSPYDHARRADITALVSRLENARMQVRYNDFEEFDVHGRSPVDDLDVPAGARVYVYGPVAFMRTVRDGLVARGVPVESIHYEAFAPGSWLGVDRPQQVVSGRHD
ncbi:FAD-binding oxidoreductase [Rhodococcus sp. HM1]|uniref:globin domain-containing protein n=1 Tax=unclassified Rhodococcus (in: high G+C Gram-positive bacteria) TaxID=192944 RepID=UPI00200ABB26|nr:MULTISPECIES: globin domain-containing protein [unclassified Rhodococcus (in: high G+C Gram-positive bacteria)]MCK8669859.1 FAD-binding oxidoreductase [Rhodococcus sp. HM1]